MCPAWRNPDLMGATCGHGRQHNLCSQGCCVLYQTLDLQRAPPHVAWCATVPQGFKGIRRGDVEAVQEALYTKGPLAVSIDAGVLLALTPESPHDRTLCTINLLLCDPICCQSRMFSADLDGELCLQGTPASVSTARECESHCLPAAKHLPICFAHEAPVPQHRLSGASFLGGICQAF